MVSMRFPAILGGRAETAPARPPDHGISLVEMVVAIALMGLTVTAIVSGLRVSIIASSEDRDHATAFVWLQAASDEIYAGPRVACTADGSGRLTAISTYSASARNADLPPAWRRSDGTPIGAAGVRVVDVEYLGRIGVDDDFDWAPDFCFEGTGFDDSPLYTQRVTVEVTFPNGTSTQTLQMVKSER